jgi:hypothetical protein
VVGAASAAKISRINALLQNFMVWLLVRAVTGGAIPKALGIMAKTNSRYREHLARTNEPEAKQQI